MKTGNSSRTINRRRWSPHSWTSPASRDANRFRCRKVRWKSGEVVLKRSWLISVAILFGAVLAFAWFQRRALQEPVYRGRAVTAWAHDMNSPDPNVRSNATLAFQAMGTNAVPRLIQNLERRDPILKKPFLSLGPKLALWVRRSFLRAFKPFDAAYDRLAAVNALGAIGADAPAPPLLNALRDPDRQIAAQTATALGRIGKPAVPGLIGALHDN